MRRSDFDFDLPEHLIAQHPPERRGDSRLLDVEANQLHDRQFADLPSLLREGDLLVFNDTRVMRARLLGHKESGGKLEALIERLLPNGHALAHLRASKSPKPGSRLRFGDAWVEVIGRHGTLTELAPPDGGFDALMARLGHIPLPPYIQRADEEADAERYQTVYARRDGAVAAPTAGLHFDQAMLERLEQMGVEFCQVTLHVGAGTFQPVRVDDLAEHQMHSEWLEVSETAVRQIQRTRAMGGRVVAVGTTSVRSLESAAAQGELRPFTGDTRLFITPGYRFRVVDAMITNFHLPQSTLLMLVSAFAGHRRMLAAYRHAVSREYRFFSYGDAMFLRRMSDREAEPIH